MSRQYVHDDPRTWPRFAPLMIAHDVGRSRDRSTAVIGGNSPIAPRRLGICELCELPLGLYGSQRASALLAVDRRYNHNALIVADLSNDVSYAENLFETFRSRLIGLQISRHGDPLLQVSRQIVIFEQNAVLQGLVPAFDLSLGLGMIRRAAHMLHALAFEPLGQIVGNVTRPIVA